MLISPPTCSTCPIAVLHACLTGMPDNLCHCLLLMELNYHAGAMDCHAAALQLSQLKACLPHLKSILASISALSRAWAEAAILPGSVSPFTLNLAPVQDAPCQERIHTALIQQTDTMSGAKHGYAWLSISTCSAYHCSMFPIPDYMVHPGDSYADVPHLCLFCQHACEQCVRVPFLAVLEYVVPFLTVHLPSSTVAILRYASLGYMGLLVCVEASPATLLTTTAITQGGPKVDCMRWHGLC
jgi:hypothetical protein